MNVLELLNWNWDYSGGQLNRRTTLVKIKPRTTIWFLWGLKKRGNHGFCRSFCHQHIASFIAFTLQKACIPEVTLKLKIFLVCPSNSPQNFPKYSLLKIRGFVLPRQTFAPISLSTAILVSLRKDVFPGAQEKWKCEESMPTQSAEDVLSSIFDQPHWSLGKKTKVIFTALFCSSFLRLTSCRPFVVQDDKKEFRYTFSCSFNQFFNERSWLVCTSSKAPFLHCTIRHAIA